MPALDIMVSVNEDMENRIDYEFFEKPTKNPRVILADSAINSTAKRTILTQECLRRLRNTKVELGEYCRNMHLNNFMVKLKNSGYNEKFRLEILDSALKAFEKMLEEDKMGIKPLFRPRDWKKEERDAMKKDKKLNWYNNEKKTKMKYKSVLFVPSTPGGVLTKQLKKREAEINRFESNRIKIVEKGGENIESILSKKDPFRKKSCLKDLCPICKSCKNPEKINIVCNTNNVGYQWICNTCEERNITKVYEGETSRSARLRGLEHLSSYKQKHDDSVLYKHKELEHADEDVEYSMKITGVFKDALTRQADEAVRIFSRKNHELLNSKSEFNHPSIARIVVEKKKKFQKQISPGV